MATSVLGSSDAILGLSFVLGSEGGDESSPLIVAADNTITLTDEAVSQNTLTASASDVLTLTILVTPSGVVSLIASDTLAVTDTTDFIGPKVAAAANVLVSLADAAHAADIFVESVADTLSLTDSAAHAGSIRVDAENNLSLTDLVDNGIYALSAEDLLTLTDDVRRPINIGPANPPAYDHRLDGNVIPLTQSVGVIGPIYRDLASVLQTSTSTYNDETGEIETTYVGLVDSVNADVLFANRAASNILSFASSANGYVVKAGAIAASAEDALSLTDGGAITPTGDAKSSITVTDTVAAVLSNEQPESTISLGDVAGFDVVRSPSIESEIDVRHSLTFTLESSDTECTYSPFIGESSDPDAPTPPSATLPTLAGLPTGVRFRLTYPATGTATDTLDLRAPELGNKDRLAFSRINREARGGTLVIFADPMWPKTQTLALTFAGLKRSQATDLLTFINAHLGEEVKLLDWEGREWIGVIMTPDEPIIQDTRDRFTASFEFEGEPV